MRREDDELKTYYYTYSKKFPCICAYSNNPRSVREFVDQRMEWNSEIEEDLIVECATFYNEEEFFNWYEDVYDPAFAFDAGSEILIEDTDGYEVFYTTDELQLCGELAIDDYSWGRRSNEDMVVVRFLMDVVSLMTDEYQEDALKFLKIMMWYLYIVWGVATNMGSCLIGDLDLPSLCTLRPDTHSLLAEMLYQGMTISRSRSIQDEEISENDIINASAMTATYLELLYFHD